MAPFATEFKIHSTLRKDGALLEINVKEKKAFSNFHYDVTVQVGGKTKQQFQIRNGQPVEKSKVRLADINADGFLDILIPGGTDHRGEDWYKTLFYEKSKGQYRWINEKPTSAK